MNASLAIQNIGLLYDGASDTPISDALILIDHDILTYAGPRVGAPAHDAREVLDAGGCVALPGLIDLHTHALVDEGTLASFLQNGVTTIRDLGSDPFQAIEWKRKERTRRILSPRIYASGPVLTCPGGYPENVWGPKIAWTVRGRYQAQERVKKIASIELDVIKVGLEEELGPCLSETEIKAITSAARETGMTATVHLTSAADFELALKAGMAEVAHVPARPIPDDLWKEAVKAKVRIIPTLHAHAGWSEEWKRRRDHPFGEHCIKGFQQGYWQAIRNLERFLSFGGDAVYGTDAGNPHLPFGAGAEEWKDLQKAGVPPIQCLKMATSKAASVLGLGSRTGTLEKGKWADLAFYREDPVGSPDNFKTIQMVFKAGILVMPGPLKYPEPFNLDFWIKQFERTGFKPRLWKDEQQD